VAKSRLTGDLPPKTFLVRLSDTNPTHSPFTLSYDNKKNERIDRLKDGRLKAKDGREFNNLTEFVLSRREELVFPCPKITENIYVGE
jgi:SH2 domain